MHPAATSRMPRRWQKLAAISTTTTYSTAMAMPSGVSVATMKMPAASAPAARGRKGAVAKADGDLNGIQLGSLLRLALYEPRASTAGCCLAAAMDDRSYLT